MNADTATISKDTAMNRLHPDTAAAVKITNVTMAKPNPSKKGMKVKVMVTLPVMGEGAMVADKEGYYTNTEVLPGYPGGQKELERFFEKNLQYPADAEDNGIEGTVKLNFAVDENGKIYSPVVTTPNIGYGVEQEAIRVFNKMPAWTPGRIKGKNVKTRFTLPVTFKLI
jgi:TonB family protein